MAVEAERELIEVSMLLLNAVSWRAQSSHHLRRETALIDEVRKLLHDQTITHVVKICTAICTQPSC
jgi:hypothetical protein